MSNLKFVPLTFLELLALKAQKMTGSRDPDHAPFSKLFQGSCWDCPWGHLDVYAKLEVYRLQATRIRDAQAQQIIGL